MASPSKPFPNSFATCFSSQPRRKVCEAVSGKELRGIGVKIPDFKFCEKLMVEGEGGDREEIDDVFGGDEHKDEGVVLGEDEHNEDGVLMEGVKDTGNGEEGNEVVDDKDQTTPQNKHQTPHNHQPTQPTQRPTKDLTQPQRANDANSNYKEPSI